MKSAVRFDEIQAREEDIQAETLSRLRVQEWLVWESPPPAPSAWISVWKLACLQHLLAACTVQSSLKLNRKKKKRSCKAYVYSTFTSPTYTSQFYLLLVRLPGMCLGAGGYLLSESWPALFSWRSVHAEGFPEALGAIPLWFSPCPGWGERLVPLCADCPAGCLPRARWWVGTAGERQDQGIALSRRCARVI